MSEFNKCSSCRAPTSTGENIDDKYRGCAPLMADGRLFTNWRPRCSQVYMDMQTGKPFSSYEGRQSLITKATDIMKKNAGDAYMNARCGPCYENPDFNTGTMLPEYNVQTCDAKTCTFTSYNKGGLGLRREYWNPQMESDYMQRFLQEKEKETHFFKANLKNVNAFSPENLPF
jgi:hypothetical protein